MADAAVSCQAPPTGAHGGPGDPRGEVLRLARSVDRLAAPARRAVGDEDASRLVEAAARELGRPLGLAGLAGEPLAHAPDDSGGRRALAGAPARARRATLSLAPGWRVVTVGPGDSPRAVLAAGAGRRGAPSGALFDPIVALLGDQLLRAGLRRDKTEA